MNSITLSIGAASISGFKSIEVHLTMEKTAGSFHAVMSGGGGGDSVNPGDPCSVMINGQIVLTGYVDHVNPKYDGKSHEISIQGRDKAGDMVDSSHIDPPFQFKNLKIDQIIKRIASPFGIGVNTKADTGAPLPTYNIDQASKAFETIHKLCKGRQCLAMSDGKGNIDITQAGANGAGAALVEGQNILKGEATYDDSKKHSKYKVKGQRQGNDSTTPSTIAENQAEVTDESVTRHRPLMLVAPGQANANDVTQRARWEASTRRGKSQRITITVAGWLSNGGSLWTTNTLVPVSSPMLFCEDVLLLSEVKFKLDQEGELAELVLVSPEAYSGKGGNTMKKGKGMTRGKSSGGGGGGSSGGGTTANANLGR